MCTLDRKRILGTIEDGKMYLSEYGKIAQHIWLQLSDRYEYVILDEFVFMPDHMHGIVIIKNRKNMDKMGVDKSSGDRVYGDTGDRYISGDTSVDTPGGVPGETSGDTPGDTLHEACRPCRQEFYRSTPTQKGDKRPLLAVVSWDISKRIQQRR